MKTAAIDCKKITSRAGLFEEIYSSLGIPGAHGSNLDALFDVLSELDGCELLLESTAELEASLGEYAPRFLSALSDMSRQIGTIKIRIT